MCNSPPWMLLLRDGMSPTLPRSGLKRGSVLFSKVASHMRLQS